MKFIPQLYDLKGCDCNVLYNYDDIQLQPSFVLPNANKTYYYTTKVYLYSLDGTTLLSDITSHFQVGYYTLGLGVYVNIKSVRYSNEMCALKCFRLRVEVKATENGAVASTYVMFNSFTDCMTIADCCVIVPPSGIIITPTPPDEETFLRFDVVDKKLIKYASSDIDAKFEFEIEENDLTVTGDQNDLDNANFEIVNNKDIYGDIQP